jgi:hypothetical protein
VDGERRPQHTAEAALPRSLPSVQSLPDVNRVAISALELNSDIGGDLAHRVVGLLERGSTQPVVLIRTDALEELLDKPWSAVEILQLAKLMIVLDEIGATRASAKIAKALEMSGFAQRAVMVQAAEEKRRAQL